MVIDLPLSLGIRGGACVVGVEEIRFCALAVAVPIPWWFVCSPGRGGRGGAEIALAARTESIMLSGRAGSAGGCSPVSCGVSGSLVAPLTPSLPILLDITE